MSTVYLNGRYLPKEEAVVSVDDRGFLLADGIYEVTPAYRGRFFEMGRHLRRLERSLAAIRIDYGLEGVSTIHERLLSENGLVHDEISTVYIQVTRGVAPRSHAFPRIAVEPTVYAFASRYVRPPMERWEEGFTAVTIPDRRWARADIKSISLLSNVMAQQAAVDAGVDDVLLVRDGVAMEGSHNNFFAVFGETVVTHPATNTILHGITREVVLEIAEEIGYAVEERAIQVEELREAAEAFFTGTTTEIRPTIRIDGSPIGDGRVGPVSRALFAAFHERTLRRD